MSDQITNPKSHNAPIRTPASPAPQRMTPRSAIPAPAPKPLPAAGTKPADVTPPPGETSHDTGVHPVEPSPEIAALQAEVDRLKTELEAAKAEAHTAAMLLEAAGVNTLDKRLPTAVNELVKNHADELATLRTQYRELRAVADKTRVVLSLTRLEGIESLPLNEGVSKLSTAYKVAQGNANRATHAKDSLIAEAQRQSLRATRYQLMLRRRVRATGVRKAMIRELSDLVARGAGEDSPEYARAVTLAPDPDLQRQIDLAANV